ncbi:MAG TPA: SDR family oxidoreductase [Solirubrobacteraceae bacterium]|jgi:NAD(P)-dependent dehydrogenase (short-subunit alcohol dehydrogenase family)
MTASLGAMGGRAAIVTGASKGIGRQLAIGLASAGSDVIVNYKTDAEGAEEVCRLINATGVGSARAIPADVSSSREARELVSAATERFGRLDLLVNNAGRTRFGPASEMTDEDFDDVVNTNLRGAFFASVAAAAAMNGTGGSIVNISSCAASLMIQHHALYTMSKGGLEALTRQLALEFAPAVRVNAIAPAPTSNARNLAYDPDYDANWGRVIPMERVAQAEDFVGPLLFLATEVSGFLTGEVLHVDGGWSLKGHTPALDAYDYSSDRARG